ncbi:hypothetical protein [Botryobacter ruber]|uniref:hypothetical protein n=1 Tax=Botryobacter ruber TaxID=2171629 RepID=UPI000E0B6A0E|nr:hypothetical protein [Botryobacter ruber]
MNTFDEFLEVIDKAYNKANLEKFYNAFLLGFLQQNEKLLQNKRYDTSMLQKKKLVKQELVVAFAGVLYDKELFNLFRDALPVPLPQVWERLLLEGPAMNYDLEKEYGVKIALSQKKYSSEPEIEPLFLCFSFKSEFVYQTYGQPQKYKIMFFLVPDIRRHLLSHIPVPDEFRLQPVAKPEDVDFIYEDNNTILEEMPLFLAYYLQGDVKYTNTGKPMAGSVNKMRKFCNSREFFPEDKEHKELINLRSQLVADALTLTGKQEQVTANVPELLKTIVANFEAGHLSALYSLLLHLKGTGYVKNNYEFAGINKVLVSVLEHLPQGDWYTFDNLKRHVGLFFPPIMPVSYPVAQNYLYLEIVVKSQYGNFKDRYHPKESGYPDLISYPLLKAAVFFFAALGLADIAYDYPKNEAAEQYGLDYISVWDGLRYVRLTPLGAYVLGQTEFYEPPKVEKSGQLYLEEDLLIINYTGEDKVTTMMLEKVASKSTATRYKVDYQTFLKDCATRKDIENKIEVFRVHIEPKPPQVWENFFQELLDKYNPLQKQAKFRVFSIPADNKELIALLARDEVLKKLVIKAEQYHILVKETDMAVLRARLEKFGFLLERGK